MRTLDTEHESCLSCKFWAGVRPEQAEESRVVLTGQCRKRAPVVGPAGTAWPQTAPEDWCAEYQVGTTPNESRRFL